MEDLELRYVALRCTKGEIRQNFYYFATLSSDVPEEIFSNEGILRWVDFEDAPSLEMPFCAKFAIEYYLKIGRYDHRLYGGTATESSLEFVSMD